MSRQRHHRPALLTALLALLAAALLVAAESGHAPPRRESESEQIGARSEWFELSRRQGLTSSTAPRHLRHQAALDTAHAITRLRQQQPMDQQFTPWRSLGPAGAHFPGWKFGNVSGRVSALARDARGTLYVGGASGGAWKSTDDGASWTSLLDSSLTQSVGAIAVDPNDPDTLWIGTGDYNVTCEAYFGVGMLRSDDGGATWQPRNGAGAVSLDSISSFAAIIVDPRDTRHLIAGAVSRGCRDGNAVAGGIFTTWDGGETWAERLGGAAVYSLSQDRQDRRVFWAGTDDGVYKSVDDGEHWIKQTGSRLPDNHTHRTEVAIAPSDGRVAYALFSGGTTGPEFWRTIDGGATWAKRSSGTAACDGQCNYDMALVVDPLDPQVVYRGTVWLFKSNDGGATWAPLIAPFGPGQEVHQDIQELLLDPSRPYELVVGSDGGVWRSRDDGLSFENLNGNLNMTQFYGIDVHPDDREQLCGGTQDNSSLARSGSGNVWQLQSATGDGLLCQIDPLDPAFVYIGAVAFNGAAIFRSASGLLGSFDTVITSVDRGVDPRDRWPWVPQYLVDQADPRTLFLASHRIYRSHDRGEHWQQVGPIDLTGTGRGSVSALEVHRHFSDTVLAGTQDGRVWRSVDHGEQWDDISAGLPARWVSDLAGDPTARSRFFAVLGGFNTPHLWEWNERNGWVARGTGLPNVPANSLVMISRDQLFVGTDVGLFRSQDGGVTFEPFMDGLPQGVVVVDLKYSARLNALTAGTYGRGAWQVTLDPIAPDLILDSVAQPLVERRGDGDGFVDPGESFELTPRLKNVGGQPAMGISTRLSTATPLVTIDPPDTQRFGDAAPGTTVAPLAPLQFSVSAQFPCGGEIVFDLTDLTSETPQRGYEPLPELLRVTVADRFGPPVVERRLDEDFDPLPAAVVSHVARPSPIAGCTHPSRDEWNTHRKKDGAHRFSAHYGRGRGSAYARYGYGWLHPIGRDSLHEPGLLIPANVTTAVLTVEHWFKTQPSADGGQLLIDAIADGRDDYALLVPDGGYSGTLRSGLCNPLQGQPAFHGKSGGWIKSRFDLSRFRGRRVYLAFVFGSDGGSSRHEGWYIDRAVLETTRPGPPLCPSRSERQ